MKETIRKASQIVDELVGQEFIEWTDTMHVHNESMSWGGNKTEDDWEAALQIASELNSLLGWMHESPNFYFEVDDDSYVVYPLLYTEDWCE